jgi:spectinomycin phosphotransferase/16S rRNA (guanine(1405)-N(7))-methyltransferase
MACGGQYRSDVLSSPIDLSEDVLVSALARGWGITVTSMDYRPVGFGSHHWEITGVGGTRWFVTADELETKRHSLRESLDGAFDRLRASLAAARGLRDCGRTFVVAPIPTVDGEPLARADDRFGVALYPFIDGQSFGWGEFSTPAHRHAVLDRIVAVHTAPSAAFRHAMADDFVVPHRDELEAGLDPDDDAGDCGPYARLTSALLVENAAPIRRLLAQYDELVTEGRTQPSRAVLTHGEPHPGNTMLTSGGWLLIDWDTALVAPPERDLWSLDPGDGSVLVAYADATGVTPLPSMLELYRIRWDLADVADVVSRFRRHHTGSLDDDESWEILRSLIAE